MSQGSSGESPSGSSDDMRAVLQAIEDTLRNGGAPKDIKISGDIEFQNKIKDILSQIITTQQFALSMAQGNISQDFAVKGQMGGSLKALQSNLRHLSWQAGQIANGDLSQRVHFMGDFSDSFNLMVEHLVEHETNRDLREDELRRVNIALADEIAERKKTEEALRLANRKITMLSSITRHDIRNQLMALRGYIEISRGIAQDPDLLDCINKEDRAAEAIRSQIEFTKYYEEIGVNAPDWQDIAHLVQAVRTQLPLPESVEIINDLPPVKVFADGLIEKVFFNLIENSLRHGGQVTRIRFTFNQTGHGAEIVYEDDGVGITPEDKPRIFQKGFGKNTGLGLFLSQEILAITGLAIRETGEPGKGVRFVIAVPEGAFNLPETHFPVPSRNVG